VVSSLPSTSSAVSSRCNPKQHRSLGRISCCHRIAISLWSCFVDVGFASSSAWTAYYKRHRMSAPVGATVCKLAFASFASRRHSLRRWDILCRPLLPLHHGNSLSIGLSSTVRLRLFVVFIVPFSTLLTSELVESRGLLQRFVVFLEFSARRRLLILRIFILLMPAMGDVGYRSIVYFVNWVCS
jgi:hypothetical protein